MGFRENRMNCGPDSSEKFFEHGDETPTSIEVGHFLKS
jgi:hypothetical protein